MDKGELRGAARARRNAKCGRGPAPPGEGMAEPARLAPCASDGGPALLACGHSAETRGDWAQVKTERSCEALNPVYCLGLYGFTVRRDGGFTAGPSDQGVVVSGAVSADELGRLSSDVSALSASSLRGAPSCDPGHLGPGVAVSV